MRFTHTWDPVQLLTWTMVSFGIIITVWQGWDCTQQYLAQPVRVEEQFIKVTDLPPLQLSICKIFERYQLTVNLPDYSLFSYDEESSADASSLPTFANTTAAFWLGLKSYHLKDFIKEIGFWNSTTSRWDFMYERETEDSPLIDMAIYPYEANSTLLCHTLQPSLTKFGSKFRLVTADKGKV